MRFPRRCFLAEDNHHGNKKEIIRDASDRSSIEVIEFNWPLYVYQRARGADTFLFTIAVWNGTKLMPICHLQPFQTALDALGQALIKAGQSQSASTPSAGSDSNGLSTAHHRAERVGAEFLSAADDHGQS